jgi:hypothetical protein
VVLSLGKVGGGGLAFPFSKAWMLVQDGVLKILLEYNRLTGISRAVHLRGNKTLSTMEFMCCMQTELDA